MSKAIQGYKMLPSPFRMECTTCSDIITKSVEAAKRHEDTEHHQQILERNKRFSITSAAPSLEAPCSGCGKSPQTCTCKPQQLGHPQTDEHLAACTSCMMAHDKALPDAVLSKTCTPADDPNYTQLVAVTEALQDAHDVHVWDGGVDDPDHKDGNCHMCAVLAAANEQIDAHRAKIDAHKQDTKPTLTAEEWADVAIALQTKMDSPSTAGDDHLSRTWRSHLATLIEEVNAHEYDFNADDWAEIYYAVLDSDANQNIVAKIGPDGTNMWK